MYFSLPLKNCTLATKNTFSPTVFVLVFENGLKQTSFCMELVCLDCYIRSFCFFDLVPAKKNVTFSNTFLKIFFQNCIIQKEKWEYDALLLVFVNKIKS